jgi:LacI family transcriptional regulator
MSNKATLKNIAEMLQISISTVSRALKDHPDIAKETKRKVRELAEVMDYEPNAFAVYLRTQQSKVLGLIVPEISNFFYHSFVASIEQEARKRGYTLLILQSGNNPEIEEANLKLCKLNRVAAIFVALTSETNDISVFKRIMVSGIPIIFFDKVPDDNQCIKVTMADTDIGKLAAKTIHQHKKKNVLALFGNPNMSITRKRKQGFVNELKKLSPLIEIATSTATSTEEAKSLALEALQSPKKIDTIFCMSDEILTGVIMAINQLHLSMPDQIAVLAISNGFIPKLTNPSITYIETSGAMLGEKSMETLFEVLDKGISKKTELITSKLIQGGSI